MANIIRIRDLSHETSADANILIPVDKSTYSTSAKYIMLSDVAAYVNTTYTLAGLGDVTMSGITEGQILRYTGGTWRNSNEIYVTGGTFNKQTGELVLERPDATIHIFLSAGTTDNYYLDDIYARSLTGLTDVSIINPAYRNILMFSGNTWINVSNSLTGLTDVSIINPAYRNVLMFSGNTWINVTGVTISGPVVDNGLLSFNGSYGADLSVESGITFNNNTLNVYGSISATTNVDIGGNLFVTGTIGGTLGPLGFPTYIFVGDPLSEFPDLVASLAWLADGKMSGGTTLVLTADNEYINSGITINLPFQLTITSGGYGQTQLTATSGMSNQPMFTVQSNVSFTRLFLSGGTATGTTIGIRTNTNDVYVEVKDTSITDFDKGILNTSNSEYWVFESVINDNKTAGFELNTTSTGARYRSSLTDYSSIRNDQMIGINLLSGNTIYLSSQQDTTELTSSAQTFVNYVGSAITYSDIDITGCIWNHAGSFKKGIDFSLDRDSNIEMFSNVGEEDHNPHAKVSWVSNTGVTDIVVQNTWYPVILSSIFNTVSYLRKFSATAQNNLTYLPEHKRDVVMWVSGNIVPNSNTNTLWEIAIIKNGNTGTTYGNMKVTTDASGRAFNFSTNVYLSDVIENDYFTFMLRNTTNNTVDCTVSDLNALVDSR